jgi:short-subunit dehydrogenase
VTVTVLCPGPTATRFQAAAVPGASNKAAALAPRLFPRAVIRKVVRAIQEPRAAEAAKGHV